MAIARRVLAEAVRALAGREDILPKKAFVALTEAARARAWTMARVTDLRVLKDMQRAVERAVAEGQSYREFVGSIIDTMRRRGWTGPEPWHGKLVFEQNLGMAYSAGRWQQARRAGAEYWRFLPSKSKNPRPEHEQYYGRIYPLGGGPMPPLDFGCKCDWEPVYADELEGQMVERGNGPQIPPDQEFQFRPASFFQPLRLRLSDWPAALHGALRRLAAEDPHLEVVP